MVLTTTSFFPVLLLQLVVAADCGGALDVIDNLQQLQVRATSCLMCRLCCFTLF